MVSMPSNSEAPEKVKDKGFLKNGGVVSNGVGRLKFYKTRSVFAIRDFPPGCGPRTASVSAPKVVENVVLESENSVEQESSVKIVSPPDLLIPQSTDQSDDDLGSAKVPEPTNNLELGTEKMEELAPVQAEPMNNSDSGAVHLTEEASRAQLEVSHNSQSPVVDSVVISKLKKFPPRPSIAALRDFPQGCGRNVPSVTIKDLRKSVDSSNERSMSSGKPIRDGETDEIVKTSAKHKVAMKDHQKPVDSSNERSMSSGKPIRDGETDQIVKTSAKDKVTVKDHQKPVDSSNVRSMSRGKPVRDGKMDQIVKTGVKDKDDKIQAGDTMSRKMNEKKEIRGAEVKSVHGKESGKDMLRQEQSGKSSIQLPREKGMSQADSSSNKKVDIGGGSSGAKSGIECVKLSKDLNFKKKFPVNQDVSLDPSGDQAVVVALMSKKNCIWSQGNKTPRPSNANQPRLEQAKKTVKSANDVQAEVQEGVKAFNSASDNLPQVEEGDCADREIVLSLMAAKKSPWKYGKKASKSSSRKTKQRSGNNL